MQVGGDINVHPSFVGRMLHMSLGIDEQTAHNLPDHDQLARRRTTDKAYLTWV
jgi:hypothetical protein